MKSDRKYPVLLGMHFLPGEPLWGEGVAVIRWIAPNFSNKSVKCLLRLTGFWKWVHFILQPHYCAVDCRVVRESKGQIYGVYLIASQYMYIFFISY